LESEVRIGKRLRLFFFLHHSLLGDGKEMRGREGMMVEEGRKARLGLVGSRGFLFCTRYQVIGVR